LPRDDFYVPTDVDALRMENELLTFEVRCLKARLGEPERQLRDLKDRLASSEDRLASSEAQLKRVEEDLVWLLRRLAKSPFARLLRLRHGYRVLEQRYLGSDA
jgi:chromosome segregation ATPase